MFGTSSVGLKAQEARSMVDLLAGSMYQRLLDWLFIHCSFASQPRSAEANVDSKQNQDFTITLLDIPGVHGKLDSSSTFYADKTVPYILCGNLSDLSNSYLQERITAVFIEQRFREEMDKYLSEGVVISSVQIPEFQVYLNLYVEEHGILDILDRVANSNKVQSPVDADREIRNKILPNTGSVFEMSEETREEFSHHYDARDGDTRVVTSCNQNSNKPGSKGYRATAFAVKHSFGFIDYDCSSFSTANRLASCFGYNPAPPAAGGCTPGVGAKILDGSVLPMLHSQRIVLAEKFVPGTELGKKGGRMYDPHTLLLDQSMCRVNALVGHIDGSNSHMGEDYAINNTGVQVRTLDTDDHSRISINHHRLSVVGGSSTARPSEVCGRSRTSTATSVPGEKTKSIYLFIYLSIGKFSKDMAISLYLYKSVSLYCSYLSKG